jgi:uncharacterized sulfatase
VTRTCVLAAVLLAAHATAADPTPSPRPNVLVVLTDDQGWPTLGCYGGRRVPTPHLDRLAAGGVRFTAAYATPQCTPTRAALLTGRHPARTRMWHVIPWYGYPAAPVAEPPFAEGLPRTAFTLAKGLKAAGYATACVGKWHLTANADGNYGGLNPEAAHYGFDFAAPPGPGSPNRGDKHVAHLTDEAVRFIDRNKGRPWFCYLAHHTLHGVVSAPPELVAKHRGRGPPRPARTTPPTWPRSSTSTRPSAGSWRPWTSGSCGTTPWSCSCPTTAGSAGCTTPTRSPGGTAG